MPRIFKKEINFLGHRRIYFIISIVLVLASLIILPVRGLNFGIEFVGGSSMNFNSTGDVSIEQMRQAFSDAGINDAIVQTTVDASTGDPGFIVRIPTTDAAAASATADKVASDFSWPQDSYEVNTIDSSWGTTVTQKSVIAFLVAIALIIVYIAIRFEYKMGISAVISLLQSLIIIIGIYAATGREVTPNVIAALLTIMGYSLYDAVVVFHRINDNIKNTARHSFMTVANHSINQVIVRSINTTIVTLVPVLAMLFFGGSTLRDFAFAMSIGLVLGPLSSIGIATPIYAIWKQREPKYKKLVSKYGEGLDEFTATEQLGGD
ncbi:MAG: protein translocase subunit SecF [Coriobacteriales bacterium]|jgi:SecD/SecF fusion protein|nr:protein translocase subunit SecF [Coriobacteriales bacterium]